MVSDVSKEMSASIFRVNQSKEIKGILGNYTPKGAV
jgi:hypothetical protein